MTRKLVLVLLTWNAKLKTQNRAQRARLHRVFRALVFGLAHAFLDRGEGNSNNRNRNENENAWEHQPLGAVGRGGYPQLILRDLTQGEPQDQRRPRPAELDHEIPDDPEKHRGDVVIDVVVGGKGADENQEQQKRY